MEVRKENYTKSQLKTVININSVYTVHYFRYGKNFKVPAESHDFWEMVYIDSGEVGIISGENKYILHQGEIFFHRPNEVHTIYTENSFGNSAIISFDCKSKAMSRFADKIFSLGEFEKVLLSSIINNTKECFSDKLDEIYLTKMTRREKPNEVCEHIMKNCIELLLLSLLKRNISNAETTAQPTEKLHSDLIVKKIIDILNQKLYSSISLDELAKQLFFSKTYIKSLFKKQTGVSIIQYYINLKIEESKKLISQDKYTYTEIAYMLGFNSVHYFSRLFKAHTEMTPSEYAKSVTINNLL